MNEVIEKLQEPFPPKRIKWRPGATNEKARQKNAGLAPQAIAYPYIDARDVMWRLDRTVGAFNWQTGIKNEGGVMMKGIGIRHPDNGEWIWRWEPGAIEGGTSESRKSILGAASVALRRAGAEWGIGRYLYHVPRIWVGYNLQTKKLTETPALPKWALPYDLQNGDGDSRPEEITSAGDDIGEGNETAEGAGNGKEPIESENAVTRPLDPEYLRKSLAMKADSYSKGNCSVEQLGLAVGMLETCFAGDQASTEKRRSLLVYLFDVDSGSNLRNGEILALLDWLKPTKNSGDAYAPDAMAVKEAQLIIRQHMLESGQKELPI